MFSAVVVTFFATAIIAVSYTHLIQEYVSEWNKFFKDTSLAKMKIGEIKPITLIRFFREVTKNREHTHKRISNARSVLNGIMSYAIEEEIISHNPVSVSYTHLHLQLSYL